MIRIKSAKSANNRVLICWIINAIFISPCLSGYATHVLFFSMAYFFSTPGPQLLFPRPSTAQSILNITSFRGIRLQSWSVLNKSFAVKWMAEADIVFSTASTLKPAPRWFVRLKKRTSSLFPVSCGRGFRSACLLVFPFHSPISAEPLRSG